MQQNVTSSSTLFLKIVFPTIWIVFFGSFILAFLFNPNVYITGIPRNLFTIILLVVFLSFLLLFYFTIMSLKRVEMDKDFIYVTNYFKQYRYPYHNIERIKEKDYGLYKIAKIYFKVPGHFGNTVFFMPNSFRFQNFLNEHPEVVEQLKR